MSVDLEKIRSRNRRLRTVFISSLPFLIALLFVAGLFLYLPFEQAVVLFGILLAYVFSPAGKETLIPLMILLGYPWGLVVICLLITDICCALVVSWNFWLLLKIPWIGTQIQRWTRNAGRYQEVHPALAHLAGAGLFFFTMIPFQGFGTITGTIIGMMLGMNRIRLFFTVIGGGFVTSLILTYGMNLLVRMYAVYPLFVTVVAVIFVAVMVGAYLSLRKSAKRTEPGSPE